MVGSQKPGRRDGARGIAIRLPAQPNNYIFSSVQSGSEAHSASYSVNRAGVEQTEGESDHSLPSNSEVRNKNYTSIPPKSVWCANATTFHLSSVMKTVDWVRI